MGIAHRHRNEICKGAMSLKQRKFETKEIRKNYARVLQNGTATIIFVGRKLRFRKLFRKEFTTQNCVGNSLNASRWACVFLERGQKSMPNILQTYQLTKTIGGKEIVKNVDIHVKKGEIYGFLGPNGAGKTSVMKMITNLWKPTGGTIELFGEKLTPTSYEVLKRMGSIIEFPYFFDHMSGKENLQLHCEYMGYYMSGSVDQALAMLGLSEAAEKAVKNYSLGMKQRLGIARAILCRPELLVLDEPTNGLDPAGMKQIRDLFHMLCTEYGMTIFISSHILSEVESIADTIGVIHHGSMMQEISMQEISERNTEYIELAVEDVKRAAYVLTEMLQVQNFKVFDEHNIRIYDAKITTGELSKGLAVNNVEIRAIGKKSESLEDYFLKLTEEGGN